MTAGWKWADCPGIGSALRRNAGVGFAPTPWSGETIVLSLDDPAFGEGCIKHQGGLEPPPAVRALNLSYGDLFCGKRPARRTVRAGLYLARAGPAYWR